MNALSCHIPWAAGICAAILTANPYPTFASILSDDVIIEGLIENQAADAAYIARSFGPDAASPIQFQSSVNSALGTFSYSTLAGTTYLGQSLSLTGSGFFDSSSDTWSLQSNGSLGGSAWTQIGSGDVNGDLNNGPLSETFDWKIPIGGGHFLDFHSATSITVPSGSNTKATSNTTYIFTLDDKPVLKIPLSSLDDIGSPDPEKRGWKDSIDIDPGGGGISAFTVTSGGTSPIDGTIGTFTVAIAPVPEPASLGLIGLGLLLVGTLGRRQKTDLP
jgi:hypothetical protein